MEKNTILQEVINKRQGHYVHAIEVHDVFDLEAVADHIILEFEDRYTLKEITEFLTSLDVYCLNPDNEDEVYEFSFEKYVREALR